MVFGAEKMGEMAANENGKVAQRRFEFGTTELFRLNYLQDAFLTGKLRI